ncbi:MAG TPA: metallophosphoesterase [Acetivibrio clariflavus]|nr:metallophosphoesterase [Acetivibrio clariflavus]
MILLFIAFVSIFITLAYMRFEASSVKVKEVFFTENINHLKVVQLSDVHISLLRVDIKKIKKVLKKENPDLVILTGDYIDSTRHIPAFFNFLEEIKGDYEIFLCYGNHDYKTFRKNEAGLKKLTADLEKKGIKVLLNDSVLYKKGDRTYNIIGIEDFRSKRHDVKKALAKCKSNVTANIAFSHNPDIALEIPDDAVDFLLCGHFHGGQIWMPFDIEFKLLRHERVCKLGIKKGLNKLNNLIIYINSGIGNVLFPLRFLSPPEITVIYFP